MDKEITTICEFVAFANEVMTNNKPVHNMYRLISKPKTLGPGEITEIKAAFSSYFSRVEEWKDFKGTITYKMGSLSMGGLEKACKRNVEDLEVFNQFIETIKSVYSDIRRNLNEFLTKLKLEPGSKEFEFMSNLFNEIGGEIIETIKSGGNIKDIATLLPKLMEMIKSGKIVSALEKLKDGSVKVSKILYAFALLVEEYEKEGAVQIEAVTQEIATDVVEISTDVQKMD